jgi:serine/threonine-protein kinase
VVAAITAAVVAGLLIAADAGVTSYRRYVVYSHSVPSLKDMSAPAADNAAAREDLLVKVTGQRYDSGVTKGDVISQSLPVGTHERGGTVIGVLLSAGPAPVAVPNIDGIYYSEAVSKLKASGLVPLKESPQYSETVYKDVVLRFSPSGVNVLPGTTIDVYVSKGPHPRVIPTSIVGGTWSAAEHTLSAMRLVPVEETEYSNTVHKGRVIGTDPSPGVGIPRGSMVHVEVSLGPEWVTIPQNIDGDSAQQATTILEAEGLYVSEVYGFGSTVLITDPEAGRTVHVGSAVALYTY